MSQDIATLSTKVAEHGERIAMVEVAKEDHHRRLMNHGRQLDRINIMGWLLLGGVATNILLTVWKR